jgi:hypothetical protein
LLVRLHVFWHRRVTVVSSFSLNCVCQVVSLRSTPSPSAMAPYTSVPSVLTGVTPLKGNRTRLDHLVVAAQTLAAGVSYVQSRLGVTLHHGGRHLQQGTYNQVTRLGEVYLEVIAPDPESAIPPAWFGLADTTVVASLATPRLLTWVAQTDDISGLIRRTAYPVFPRAAQRDVLKWQFGFTADGGLLAEGLLPYLIEWQSDPPTASLPATGYKVIRLEGTHPDATEVNRQLQRLGLEAALQVQPASQAQLRAHIETPDGQVVVLE